MSAQAFNREVNEKLEVFAGALATFKADSLWMEGVPRDEANAKIAEQQLTQATAIMEEHKKLFDKVLTPIGQVVQAKLGVEKSKLKDEPTEAE